MADKPKKEQVWHCTTCTRDLREADWKMPLVKNAEVSKTCPQCGSPVSKL